MANCKKSWKERAELHMSKTKHSVQWTANGWSCNTCSAKAPVTNQPKVEDAWDGGQYFDNFVDGRGF